MLILRFHYIYIYILRYLNQALFMIHLVTAGVKIRTLRQSSVRSV